MSKSHKDPVMSTPPDSKSRRHWSAAEKAKLVRRHLRDGVPVATLADENGTAPSMVYAWVRAVLDGADQVLSDKRERDGQRSEKQLAAKDDRIRHLEEVTAELSMEVLQLKKARGAT
jgi:transposase-like protein